MDQFIPTPEMRMMLGGFKLLSNFLMEKLAQADPRFRALGDAARDEADSLIAQGGLAGISNEDQARSREALRRLQEELKAGGPVLGPDGKPWREMDERQEGRSEVVREVVRGGTN